MWEKKSVELRNITPTYAEGNYLYKKFCKNLKGKVLDAGCGANAKRRNILPRNIDYLGIDVSDIVEKSAIGFKFMKADLNKKLNLPSHQFDVIICWSTLEHIKNDDITLSEFNRILKVKGTLILQVPLHPKAWDYMDTAGGHYRRYRYFDLKRQLLNHGFIIKKRRFMRTGLIFLYKKLIKFINKSSRERYFPDPQEKPVLLLKKLNPLFKLDRYLFSTWGYWGLNVAIEAMKYVELFRDDKD